MKKLIVTLGMAAVVIMGQAQTAFTPGRLAVLRTGNGQPNGSYDPTQDWNTKQNADYIDEFLPNVSVPTAPTYTMAFPTNGVNAIWNNGNAGTEACSLGRSADRSILTYSAYNGDILSLPGTPSALGYNRIISVIDAYGTNGAAYVGNDWYGLAASSKANPRGVVSDGTNQFWGAGNSYGTLYCNPTFGDAAVTGIQNYTPTRAVKIINGTVYTTITGKDSLNNYPCGIFDYVSVDLDSGIVSPDPMPTTANVGFQLVVPAATKYTNISGFFMNNQGTIAYMADQVWGVQKYVNSGGVWQFQCNFNVQGYEQSKNSGGLVVTNDTKNSVGGAWDVVADFSGTNPVIYATTCDFSFYNGNFNSNRIVRIVDTNTAFSGVDITNFTVIAIAHGTNVAFRGIDFTPDLRPVISSSSGDLSVVTGSPASFSVSATESYRASTNSPISYQWYENDTTPGGSGVSGISGATASTVTINGDAVYLDALNYNTNVTIFCVASNNFGSVTSSPANLYVTATPQPPTNSVAELLLTNIVGGNQGITVSATGTSPLSYQWYTNSGGTLIALNDVGEYSGTATSTLQIGNAQKGMDDTNYYCIVTNFYGSATNLIANLKLVYTPPVFSATPASTIVLSNTPASLNCTVFGSSASYQWFTSNKVAIAGQTSSSLTINPATANQGYYVVVTNLGGSITSSVATVTVIVPPPYSFVSYTNAGQTYLQNFDSLPVVTNSTVNTANPVTIFEAGTSQLFGGAQTYSVADPFDFTYPVFPSGGVGGLGLTNTMKGWYGWGAVSSKLGAHQGDQSTGGVIDYGTLNPTNTSIGSTNRALGIQSTSTTGSSAFGVKLINNTTNALSYVTLSYIGELWRNQPGSNSIVFSYYIDVAGTNSIFVPTNPAAVFVPNMNINFNTNAGGLLILDGTQSSNQVNVAVTNLAIGSWPTNAALWLVWQQLNSPGSQQGEAIDNLSFSATSVLPPTVITPLNITAGSAHITGSGASAIAQFAFTNATGLSFSILATNNISAPVTNWPVIGTAVENPAGSGSYQFTDPNPATNTARFYILRQP